ncbi:MAG: hypothetical protein KGL04_08050, partial [Elusimicrobia bacterium]|nr:hypothetical protein [Elusimicrobiota bacterium]
MSDNKHPLAQLGGWGGQMESQQNDWLKTFFIPFGSTLFAALALFAKSLNVPSWIFTVVAAYIAVVTIIVLKEPVAKL